METKINALNEISEPIQNFEAQEELMNLGEKIQLSGFKQIDRGNMSIVKKIVGNQVRKIQESLDNFERLKVHLKPIHKTEKSMNHELHAELIYSGKVKNAETTNRNIFMGLSEIFRSFENQLK